ncbi:glycosyltransferase family 39 protein [Actinoplanes sp. NBC_00393]|uniref:ArnT family glycosyltransferase n=1 Tax=Actinoplanes sp. NBC_00393 TaxID=2975953 RepID=UPI002E1B0244
MRIPRQRTVTEAPPAPPQPRAEPPARPSRWWIYALVIAGLLGQMAFAMVTAARQQSPIVDEPVYVSTSLVYLQDHSLEYNFEHPPLAKLIMATGLASADARMPPPEFEGSQWQLGEQVLYQQGNDAQELLFLARLPMIILTLLFGLVVFSFARDLAGPLAGLAALGLYAFSPDVIAHGSLATLDMPAAGFLLTALWLLWRARTRPYRYLPLAGIALGAALATKMSTLPALPLAALLAVLSMRHARIGRRLAAGAGVVVIAIATTWVTYLLVDPGLRWTTPADLPVVHGLTGTLIDWLPLPEPFRDGARLQFGFEDMAFPGFLLGEAYTGSKWYYLPVALLIKEPLGMLVLWIAGATAMVVVPRLRIAAVYVLAPTAVLLLVAMGGSRDWGVRYAIFVPVILAVAAGCVLAFRQRWTHIVALLLVLSVAVSSVRTFPYYLPYSNEAFGGPGKTYLRLADSNVDWGQDLARLGDRLAEKYPGQPVWMAYKGRGNPGYYGIRAKHPLTVPEDQVRGIIAVSTNCLRVPFCIPVKAGIDPGPRQLDELLDSSRLVGHVGHSILIYRR